MQATIAAFHALRASGAWIVHSIAAAAMEESAALSPEVASVQRDGQEINAKMVSRINVCTFFFDENFIWTIFFKRIYSI